MKILLDTHALLWWLSDDARMGKRARDLLNDTRHDILYSIVSLWEIVEKTRVGKLRVEVGVVAREVARSGFLRVDISVPHLETLATLPLHHRDPFDHLLMAQAISENAILLSDDRKILRYPVQAMTCSDQAPGPRQS